MTNYPQERQRYIAALACRLLAPISLDWSSGYIEKAVQIAIAIDAEAKKQLEALQEQA